jgi:hypothetical protein
MKQGWGRGSGKMRRICDCEYRRYQRGQASKIIHHASELKPGQKAVLWCRVSGCEQNRQGNLDDNEAKLTELSKDLRTEVVGVIRYVGSGTDPICLVNAVDLAKKLGAVLLAESTDRFIRHPAYHSKENPNAQAREPDLEELQYWTQGVELYTDLHPDASPQEVRSYQRKRGQKYKGNKGGRPRKRKWKKRRFARYEVARKLREEGKSIRQITNMLNELDDGFGKQSFKTTANWLKRGV